MPSPYLPSFDRWDDPVLCRGQPLLDVFASWSCQLEGGATRSTKERLVHQLVGELHSIGIQESLLRWVDMAIRDSLGHDLKKRAPIDKRLVRLFVECQWALFNDVRDQATQLLERECYNQGSSKLAKVNPWATPRMHPNPSTGSLRKREAQVEKRGEAKRRRTLEVTQSAGGSAIVPMTAGGQTATIPQSYQSVPTEKSSINSEIRQGKVGLKSREKQPPDAYGQTQLKRGRKPLLNNRKDTTNSTLRKTKKADTSSKSNMPTIQLLKGETTEARYANDTIHLPPNPPEAEAIIPEAPSAIIHDSGDLVEESEDTVMEPGSTISELVVGVKTLERGDHRFSNQLQVTPDYPSPRPPPILLNESAEGAESTVTIAQKNRNLEELTSLSLFGPAVRPSLPHYPPIWAQSRQEVCESFDWFRSYQGGVYHTRGIARGYLLSAFSARRDIWAHDGKLIISHGGGKAQSVHSHLGQSVTQEADDQLAQDNSVSALLANYRSRRPLVLLIDDRYTLFPYELGLRDITYAVLGFYTIVHAWAEYQSAGNQRGRVVRYKFAFQWCESQGKPWWHISEASPLSTEICEPVGTNPEESAWVDQSVTPFEHIEQISTVCGACNESSPQVYTHAWSCLNSDCRRFWVDSNGLPLGGDELEYNLRFIQLAPATSLGIPVEELAPTASRASAWGPTTDYACTRGWHCKKCGRLSCRFKWEHWECKHCKETLPVERRIRDAKEFLYLSCPVAYHNSSIAGGSDIHLASTTIFKITPDDANYGQCYSYKLPGTRGFIHHIKLQNPLSNREADEIFRTYQEQASTGALPFRRWPMRAHKCEFIIHSLHLADPFAGRGQLLTNYFSQNAGVPYRYVGGTENTLPFDEVPDAVVKARDLIQTRIRQALHRDVSFNEVLSAAYMERQRMAFHTDDEIGLGPFVAGLSLGSPALMHFRLLARYVPQGVQRTIAISFVLRHGDILAMDGEGVQHFYEQVLVHSTQFFRQISELLQQRARSMLFTPNAKTLLNDIPTD